jgi:hypothetical protein
MTKRDELLQRLSRFQTIPGHGPDINKATDEELERFVSILECMSERGREAKGEGE